MYKNNLIVSSILIGIIIFKINSSLIAQTTTDSKSTDSSIDMALARKTIESIDAHFSEDFKNGDSLALATYYAKDGKFGSIKGKEIISAWGKMIRDAIKNSTPNLIFKINSLSSDGEFLVELGIYKSKDNEGTVKSSGKYLVIWKQEYGKWKIYRDIGL